MSKHISTPDEKVTAENQPGEKLIIHNLTGLPIAEIFPFIEAVIRHGRVSNDGKQYCYASVWPNKFYGKQLVIVSDLNASSDRLTAYLEETPASK